MMTIAVAIATKGRASDLSCLLQSLRRQSVPPDRIIISACELDDINEDDRCGIEIVLGKAGLSAQRNRALACTDDVGLLVFFDDDFVPSRFWLERARDLFTESDEIVCATGRILADGVKRGDLTRVRGEAIVTAKDKGGKPQSNNTVASIRSPYGCNMAFRRKALAGLEFDERLALYGWLEDLDFGVRASRRGRTVRDDGLWGVHLGIRRGRVPGVNYGYSQVVNPWYLMRKGTLSALKAIQFIARAVFGNLVGMMVHDAAVDRFGRLKGNIVGASDIVTGQWQPERAGKL